MWSTALCFCLWDAFFLHWPFCLGYIYTLKTELDCDLQYIHPLWLALTGTFVFGDRNGWHLHGFPRFFLHSISTGKHWAKIGIGQSLHNQWLFMLGTIKAWNKLANSIKIYQSYSIFRRSQLSKKNWQIVLQCLIAILSLDFSSNTNRTFS